MGALPWVGRLGAGGSPSAVPLKATCPQISKPLMEKKRRARINVSLEQLKTLLEKHYSHQVRPAQDIGPTLCPNPSPASPHAKSPPTCDQIRKRKLEKADILELSVKYMKSLQTLQGRRRGALVEP